MSGSSALLIVAAFALSMVGVWWWRRIALRLNIVSVPNTRTLHTGAIPVGGGIVIAAAWLCCITFLYLTGSLERNDYLTFFVGGGLLALMGAIDDATDINPLFRFVSQIFLVAWGLYWLGGFPVLLFFSRSLDLGWFGFLLGVWCGLWMINLINFMDGIDGMLASGTIFICLCMGAFLYLEGDVIFATMLFLLAVTSGAFLWFNWPPARLFMGDVGSVFLGYTLAMLVIATTREHPTLLWVWLIIMGYFLTDTTTTLLIRMRFVRPFYGTHRHHAYQSIARRTDNHLLVTRAVLLVKILWLLPLAVMAYVFRDYGPLFLIVALTPLAIFCAKQGVLHELK